MTANGSVACHGADCTNKPVAGMSYCSEDHYEELVEERKARNRYRTGNHIIPATDYTATLKPATNQGLEKTVEEPQPEPERDPPERDPRWMRGASPEKNRQIIADVKLPIPELMKKYEISETAVRNLKHRCAGTTPPSKAANDLPNVTLKAPISLNAAPSPFDVVLAHLQDEVLPRLRNEVIDVEKTIQLLKRHRTA